jgi:hypothetical protein
MIVYKRGDGYKPKRVYKTIRSGRGYRHCSCEGSGVFDVIKDISKPLIDFATNNKDFAKNIGETAINAAKVGHNTKQIVNAIKNDYNNMNLTTNEKIAYDHKNLKDVIARINRLKVGSGFRVI